MPDRRRQLAFRGLIVTAAALIALAVLATVLTIVGLHNDATQDAERDAGNIATVLAEQTARSVQAIDVALIELQGRVAAAGIATPDEFRAVFGSEEAFQALHDAMMRLSEADVDHADRRRRPDRQQFARLSDRATLDLSDRDYFVHARDHVSASLFVSKPLTNRATGSRAIVFSRRLESASGTFLGVAVVNVEIGYFRHVYESISSLTDRAFLFTRSDGVVLVRHPEPRNGASERVPPQSPWYRTVAEGGGYFRTLGTFDGFPRIVAVRPLAGYPLVVNVGIAEASALALWRRRATLIGIGAALTLLGFAFLLRAFVGQFRALMASEGVATEREARLNEKSGELERANARFDAALNNMSQGLCLFDAGARIVVCNQQYLQMYNLSPDRGAARLHAARAHRASQGDRVLHRRRRPVRRAHPRERRPGPAVLLGGRGERRPLRARAQPADRERRLGRDPRGRHRALAQRGAHRPHGAARRADRPAQPRAVHGEDERGAGPARRVRHPVLGVRVRPRPVQGGQRFARSPDRRPAAQVGGEPAAELVGEPRHGRPARRRRVRHPAGGRSTMRAPRRPRSPSA